jgi:hypothetical protein
MVVAPMQADKIPGASSAGPPFKPLPAAVGVAQRIKRAHGRASLPIDVLWYAPAIVVLHPLKRATLLKLAWSPLLAATLQRVGPSIYFTRDMGGEQQVELGIGAFAGLTRGAPAAMLKFNVSISAGRR